MSVAVEVGDVDKLQNALEALGIPARKLRIHSGVITFSCEEPVVIELKLFSGPVYGHEAKEK